MEEEVSTTTNRDYLVLLTSTISEKKTLEEYIGKGVKIILVCDVPYSIVNPLNFGCDNLAVFSDNLQKVGGFLRKYDSQGVDLYVIPENLLISPSARSNIEKYFQAFRRSDAVPHVSEDMELVTEMTKETSSLEVLIRTTTFEIFVTAFLVFLLISVPIKLFYRSSSAKKEKYIMPFSTNKLFKERNYLTPNFWVLVYGFIFLTVLYAPIILILGVRHGRGFDLGYFLAYSLDTFKIKNLVDSINQENYFRPIIFLYNLVYLIAVTAFLTPYVINTLSVASNKIRSVKLRGEVQKYATPLLLVLIIIVSSFLKISESYRFLILVILVLVFMLFANSRHKVFDQKYSLSEKVLFIFCSLVVVFSGLIFTIRENRLKQVSKNEDLIGIDDDVVTLPYSKQMGKNVIFNNFLISFPEPVFVNKYLVYYPKHFIVENKNANEFKNSGFYYIQNGNIIDMISAIYSNGELSKAMILKTPSNFFKVGAINYKFGQKTAKIQISFLCSREDLGVNEVKSNFFYLASNGKIEISEKTLFYFPGCSKVGEPETVTSYFNLPYTKSDNFFMKLINVSGSDIKDIKIILINKILEPSYYSIGEGFEVIASGGQEVSSKTKITNYIFGDSYDLSFDLGLDSEGKFNISKPINELVKQGVLKDNFLIWSTKKYVPIRLDE
ncbi:MAG: hypothetical protein WC884_03830 [Candidatus Paceibacterota bacterium]